MYSAQHLAAHSLTPAGDAAAEEPDVTFLFLWMKEKKNPYGTNIKWQPLALIPSPPCSY